MKPRTELSMQLYNMLLERGYLSHYSYLPELEVVDEMLAILIDRISCGYT